MALIPPFFPDCVVAIGVKDTNGNWECVASSFILGKCFQKVEEKKSYNVYLVTNRHVFENEKLVYLRFNPLTNEPAREYRLDLVNGNGEIKWFPHPDAAIDVAVIPININLLKEHAMQVNYFRDDEHAANVGRLNELGITEGDFVYVLGFPMGLIGGERNVVIVRSGSIARIRDVLARDNNKFLIDAFVFPGNSGGPVVSKPEALAIKGTKNQKTSHLIGIVKSYIPYQDIAISQQTNRPKVIFEENSGLAAVHPIDFIIETIDEYEKSQDKKGKSEQS